MAAGSELVPSTGGGHSELVPSTSGGHVELGYGPTGNPGPLSNSDLERLDEALTLASWESGIDFSVFIGDLGEDKKAFIADLHRGLGAVATNSCLIAVSPTQRAVEIATGKEASRRLPDRSCNLAVLSMTANFGGGDLVGGLVNGLRMLADQAGRPTASS